MLTPARWPRESKLDEKLLVVDAARDRFDIGRLADLPQLVALGSLVVVNDSATLPASLRGATSRGEELEARLLVSPAGAAAAWRAVLFGPGDWTTRTEERAAPPSVAPGDKLAFEGPLTAWVQAVDARSRRLVTLRFEEPPDRLYMTLYRVARPVQYSYVRAPLALWHMQTVFAARPWASEMPSAGRPLAWQLIASLRSRGVGLATVTHAAGLSATGDSDLDRALPLRESYEVPAATAGAISETRAAGGTVVAVGTTVVRALEACAAAGDGTVVARAGETELRLDAAHRLRAVDAILTGMHEPGTSHARLLEAFAPAGLLARATRAAEGAGFVGHEFGDSMLVLGAAV